MFLNKRIKELEKQSEVQRKALGYLREFVNERFDKLDANGVATAINKLNKEVFENEKNGELSFWASYLGTKANKKPTLAGKVDAIVEHLGLDVEVISEEVMPSKVVAKKKVVSKKKGRR